MRCIRIDVDHWDIEPEGFLHDLCGAANSRRGTAVPYGDEDIAMADEGSSGVQVSDLAIRPGAIQLQHGRGAAQQTLILGEIGTLHEIVFVFESREWQDALE